MVYSIKYIKILVLFLIVFEQYCPVNCKKNDLDYMTHKGNCDFVLTEQLKQQNIQYECQNTQIFIQNLDFLEMELQIKDNQVESPLFIKNVNHVTINQLAISDSQLRFSDSLISLININKLVINNFKVQYMYQIKYLFLIDGQNIQSCQINQLHLSNQVGIYNEYQIRIKADLLVIQEIYVQNIFNIFTQLYGQTLLSVDRIFILQNINFEKQKDFSKFQIQYFSNLKVDINILNIEVHNMQQEQKIGEQLFAQIEIQRNDNNDQSEIIVNQISYNSSKTQFQNFGIIQFNTLQRKTSIKINSIESQQKDSQYYLQIQLQQIFQCFINQIKLKDFGNSFNKQSYNQNTLFQLKYVKQMQIQSIIFEENSQIEGTLFNGSLDELKIYQLKVEQFVVFSQAVLELQNSQFIQIYNLNIESSKLNDYLFYLKNIQSFILVNSNINNIFFSQQALFYFQEVNNLSLDKIQLKGFDTFQQQSAIFQIKLSNQENQHLIQFSSITANLKSSKNLQFLNFQGVLSQIEMSQSLIMNGSSTNFGGCLNFKLDDQQNIINPYIKLTLSSTILTQCYSKYLGGAISGISISFQDQVSKIINSNSNISGGIYQVKSQNQLDLDNFFNNTGYLTSQNFNKQPLEIKIQYIQEINTDYDDVGKFITVDEYLYPGLVYLIRIAIQVDGEWYYQYNQQSFFGNIYDLVVDPSDNYISQTPLKLQGINYPFILWYAQDIEFNEKQTVDFKLQNINLVEQYSLDTKQYKIFNGCKDQGMEKVYLEKNNKQSFVCKYCDYMKASYNGTCQTCQVDLFSECYGNFSNLRESYWRSSYSIDPVDVFYCSNNPQNCIGGNEKGNQLCYQGHVGPQCLDCDIKGTYWGEKFSAVGFFQCNIKHNYQIMVYLTIIKREEENINKIKK
ncbi:hypothetical protein ABPG73_017860 [Tetrahymena malaccensis]